MANTLKKQVLDSLQRAYPLFEEVSCGSLQTFSAFLVVEELIRLGVRTFIVSPGARAIPLILVLEQQKQRKELFLKVISGNDERAAGFMAQGVGKSGELAALICTSGTAAANYLPAVVEASYAKVPLLVITCDRPWELQNAGANQTIKQSGIYSSFVRMHMDIPAPEKLINPHSLLSNVYQLVKVAREEKGPVHLNVSYRKPFFDAGFSFAKDVLQSEQELLARWWLSSESYIRQQAPHCVLSDTTVDPQHVDSSAHRVLVVVGPLNDSELEARIAKETKARNVPVIADINSQLRLEKNINILSHFNLYINHPSLESYLPEVVYYVGDRFISDQLHCYLSSLSCPIVRVSDERGRQDAIENEFVEISEVISKNDFFEHHLSMLVKSESQFYDAFLQIEQEAEQFSRTKLINYYPEASFIRAALEKVKSGSVAYLSPSLIFREADYYLGKVKEDVRIYTNRGATGIDGVIASAVGAAVASESNLLAIVGDQTALHDLTSLSLLREVEKSAVILIVNNYGGAIFNIINHPLIEASLRNSHACSFEDFARGFGLSYDQAETISDVESIIEYAEQHNEKVVVEVTTDGKKSARSIFAHNDFSKYISQKNKN